MAEIKTWAITIPLYEMEKAIRNPKDKLLATAKMHKGLVGCYLDGEYANFLFGVRAEAIDFFAEAEEQGYHPIARGVAFVDEKNIPKKA